MRVLRVHIVSPSTVTVGSAVPFKLVLKNISPAKTQVLQSGPGPEYDVTVTRPDGRIVWQRVPPDAVLLTAGTLYTLAPGQSRELEPISWDQRDLHGRAVEPGRYTVHGVFYGGVAYSGKSETPTDTISISIER